MLEQLVDDIRAASEPDTPASAEDLPPAFQDFFSSRLPIFDQPNDNATSDTLSKLVGTIYDVYHGRQEAPNPATDESFRPPPAYALIDDEVIDAVRARLGENSAHWLSGFSPTEYGDDVFFGHGFFVRASAEDLTRVEQDFSIRFSRVYPYRSRGFVSVCGSSGFADPQAELVRVYFGHDFDTCLQLFSDITETLDSADLTYTLKLRGKSEDFARTDNMVLYVEKPSLLSIWEKLIEPIRSHTKGKSAETSIFCKQIAPGVGLSEEKPGGDLQESFGLHRSRLVAEAIVGLDPDRPASREEIVASIRRSFSKDGISDRIPYLSFSWSDDYG